MTVRLTQTVQKGGCAAKISAEVLRDVLGKLNIQIFDPNVLVDGKDFDDAAIYRIDDDLALVQTLDFFTPIVDDPKLFGEIASANAMSDVYAMGGLPKTCLCILAFPLVQLDHSIMLEVMQGAQKKILEARASMVGGHSIDDDTLKFGLSVTGLVNPKNMWTNKGAKVGDKLILTKALGTGTLTAGLKKSLWHESDINDAIESMAKLNDIVSLLSQEDCQSIHAATDVTGFALAGHAVQMGKASQVTLNFSYNKLPKFQNALASLKAENLTKAHRTNKEYTKNSLNFSKRFESYEEALVFDPQTSGGLLLSVANEKAEHILKIINKDFKKAEIVGEVGPKGDHVVQVNA